MILNFIKILEVFASDSGNKQDIVSGVVPHHLLAEEIIEDFFSYISSRGKPKTIVILSPDHFQSGVLMESNTFITIGLEGDDEEFNNLKVDTLLWRKLFIENKMALNNSAVIAEHGVTTLFPY
ncbi:unnamed protein product, partial [marine sediment metagenome]